MLDVYVIAVLSDRTLHKLARNATDQRVALGMELDLDYSKVEQIRQEHSDATDQAFHVLLVSATISAVIVGIITCIIIGLIELCNH